MQAVYGSNLDLNLLRVFVVVAEAGSVTAAASRLYLTQPAVSAALRRLNSSLGAPLFARAGRGLVLTARGTQLLSTVRPLLESLVEAALHPAAFDPKTSERTIRLGFADTAETWLLPRLLAAMAREAPHMKLIVLPVQFRTVFSALASSAVDVAVTVADEAPAGVERQPLFHGRFVCLFDPRHAQLGAKPSLRLYLEQDHVIVSYNGDLRGIVEDALGVERRVRVSVPTFHSIGAVVEGTALVATVPAIVARDVLAKRPKLRMAPLPVALRGAPMEMLWRTATTDDQALGYVRELIARIGRDVAG